MMLTMLFLLAAFDPGENYILKMEICDNDLYIAAYGHEYNDIWASSVVVSQGVWTDNPKIKGCSILRLHGRPYHLQGTIEQLQKRLEGTDAEFVIIDGRKNAERQRD